MNRLVWSTTTRLSERGGRDVAVYNRCMARSRTAWANWGDLGTTVLSDFRRSLSPSHLGTLELEELRSLVNELIDLRPQLLPVRNISPQEQSRAAV